MKVVGKGVRWNGKQGQRKDWKKAIIRFPKGKTINVYDA
jgi:ribosomal protein L23